MIQAVPSCESEFSRMRARPFARERGRQTRIGCHRKWEGSLLSRVHCGMRTTLSLSAVLLSFSQLVSAQVLINEVDANTPGSEDRTEFVELFNPTRANLSLRGHALVMVNGFTDTVYAAYDLGGVINGGDFYVLSAGGVPNTDQVVLPSTHWVQNGADAVVLVRGSAADFPEGFTVRELLTAEILDAIVYGIDDPTDAELVALLAAGQRQVDEEAGMSSASHSMQRCPDGAGGSRVTAEYGVGLPSPGVRNECLGCGDGVVGRGEQCDDGAANGTEASCCSSSCAFESAGSTCDAGGAASACNLADRCDGRGSCTEVVARFGTVCRRAAGACDIAEVCDGRTSVCPRDALALRGSPCRDRLGVCDREEVCDGGSAACPADRFESGTICRPAAGLCDQAEICGGDSRDCPADRAAPEGSSCDRDALICNGGGLCRDGDCVASAPLDCDDENACTADSCAEPGGCEHTPVEGCCLTGADCDDGDACTEDACTADNRCISRPIEGCGMPDGGVDAGMDGGVDAGEPDASMEDSGVGDDAGALDSGVGEDAGALDSGVEEDAGAERDAGGEDAGSDGGFTESDSDGCGCHVVVHDPSSAPAWSLLVLGWFAVRRRRR